MCYNTHSLDLSLHKENSMRMRTQTKHQFALGGLVVFIIAALTVMWNEFLLHWLVRLVLAALTVTGVLGCTTNSFAADLSTTQELQAPTENTVRFGRFTVRQVDGGQVIEGGVFTPPETMSVKSNAAHVLIIDYTAKELLYYRKVGDGLYEPVVGYAVMTPEPSFLPHSEVRGWVRDIDLKPSWCPKAQARRIYRHLQKGCLPPGHPDNMMGEAKFLISWQGVRGWEAIHVHGTSGYKAGAFWEQETLGCTRLTNEAIRELIDLLGPQAVKEGIEVVLIRGNTFQRHAL